MVRFLVGSIVYCVEGRFAPLEIEALLQGGVDHKAPFCAPADGLKLEKVFYPESLQLEHLKPQTPFPAVGMFFKKSTISDKPD